MFQTEAGSGLTCFRVCLQELDVPICAVTLSVFYTARQFFCLLPLATFQQLSHVSTRSGTPHPCSILDNYNYAKGCNYWSDLPGKHDGVNTVCHLLEKMNFECASTVNATGAAFQCLAGRIARRLQGTHGALALIKYDGHAMAYKGRLYLIPTDYADQLASTRRWFLMGLLAALFPAGFREDMFIKHTI